MKQHYYLNKNEQPTGEHEVHTSLCKYRPLPQNRIDLGYFDNCYEAINEARMRNYKNVDGCFYCCKECHTK